MGVTYVKNPKGSRFYYDVVDDPKIDDFAEFRKARIERGWTPDNPNEDDMRLIAEVEAKKSITG